MGRQLITEREVREAPEDSTLRLDPGALVTPAARDLASLRRIRLEESADSELPAPLGLRDGARVDLPDGEWLLEVRGGRARLRRIDDPPR